MIMVILWDAQAQEKWEQEQTTIPSLPLLIKTTV